MGCADIDVACTHFLQLDNRSAEGTCGINHVVVNNAGLALDIADDTHNSTLVVTRTALMCNSKAAVQVVRELLSSLCATHIRGDNNGILPVKWLALKVIAQKIESSQVRNRNVKEALDLALVQVKGDDAVNASVLKQVCHQTSGNRLASSGFAVLTSICVVRDNHSKAVSRCALCGVSNNQRFHNQVVDVDTSQRLNEEDLVAADRLVKASIDFSVSKLLKEKTL